MTSSRIFGYSLGPINDFEEINAFFPILESRQLTDNVAASMLPAIQRPKFSELVTKLEAGDSLVVVKLAHLGSTFADIVNSLEILELNKIGVVSLDIESKLLNSMQIELVKKVLSSFKRSASEVKVVHSTRLGRPSYTTAAQKAEIYMRLVAGESVSSVARAFELSRSSIINIREKFKC